MSHPRLRPSHLGHSAKPHQEHSRHKRGEKFDATLPPALPSPSMRLLPIPRLLTAQQRRYDQVLQFCRNIRSLSNGKKRPATPLTAHERMWLSRECILRYLRATKWRVDNACQRIESTLKWRREFNVDNISIDRIEFENSTGKNLNFGFDIHGRPCVYLLPTRQNTKASHGQIELLVYTLERAVDLMPPGVESLALLIDFTKASRSNTPSVGQSREVLNILQNHYAERLGNALLINVPWFFWTLFRFIQPFIDPVTREKIKFNQDITQHVPHEQLLSIFGGDAELIYDVKTFVPYLNKICAELRASHFERWKSAGGDIGLSEFDYKGGDQYFYQIPHFQGLDSVHSSAYLHRKPSETSATNVSASIPVLRVARNSTEYSRDITYGRQTPEHRSFRTSVTSGRSSFEARPKSRPCSNLRNSFDEDEVTPKASKTRSIPFQNDQHTSKQPANRNDVDTQPADRTNCDLSTSHRSVRSQFSRTSRRTVSSEESYESASEFLNERIENINL